MADWATPLVVEDDTSDLDALVEGPGTQTEGVRAPWRDPLWFRRAPVALDTTDEEPPADGVKPPWMPKRTVVSEAELRELVEAAAFKTELHPRWPKGSGEKAGQFMEVGQQFMSGGKKWEIAHIVNGRIYAHEASASVHSVETRGFDVAAGKEAGTGNTVLAEHVTPIAASVPKGGTKESAQLTVVDPYVDSSSHDPSIPIPEGSEIAPDEWLRFGRLDQEHYSELMARFGSHKTGAAKDHIDKSYAGFSAAVQQLVKTGYAEQYSSGYEGQASGFSLALAAGSSQYGIKDTPQMAKLREEAKQLQAEHQAAVQWDLYNRTHSPDLFVVHKSSGWTAETWQKDVIDGDVALFSGLSQSYDYRRSFFGSHGIATPLAIRHVLMSTKSAQPVPGKSYYSSELEIATIDRLKVDHRSLALTMQSGSKHSLTSTQMTWLEGMTQQPAGGHLMDVLKDAIATGKSLPVPPAAPKVTMDGAGGKTWIDPPDEAAAAEAFKGSALPSVSGSNIPAGSLPKELPWIHTEADGSPKAVEGKDTAVEAGQYFMGLKGTLYWIGNDPGVGGGYPFRIHKIVDGKFNGETFAYNAELPGYYLNASYAEPKPVGDAEVPKFEPSAWVQSTDAKFLEAFDPGEKFKLNGATYEVTGVQGGMVKIKDLDSGLTGKINGDYKSTHLVPQDGSVGLPEAKPFAAGDLVQTPFGQAKVLMVGEGDDGPIIEVQTTVVGASGNNLTAVYGPNELTHWDNAVPAAPGVTFNHEGKKAVVTKILADGTIQANLKPGVLKVTPAEWESQHQATAFNPTSWDVSPDKVKLGAMSVGDHFQGGAGSETLRPYQVVHIDPASKTVHAMNLDTGEVVTLKKAVSYRPLLAKAPDAPPHEAAVPTKGAPEPLTGAGHVGPAWDPAKFELTDVKALPKDLPVGTFLQSNGGHPLQIVAQDPDATVIDSPDNADGLVSPIPVLHEVQMPLGVYQLKGQGVADDPSVDADAPPLGEPATTFDPSGYLEGGKLKIGEMRPGTVFKTDSKAGPKYYQLSDDGTHTTNLLTGKVYEVKPHYKATPLKAKHVAEPEVDPEVHAMNVEVADGELEQELLAHPTGAKILYGHPNGSTVMKTKKGYTVYPPGDDVPSAHFGDAGNAAHEVNKYGTAAQAAKSNQAGPQYLSDLAWKKGDQFSYGYSTLTAAKDKAGGGGGGSFTDEHGTTHVLGASHKVTPLSPLPAGPEHNPAGTNKAGTTFGALPKGALFSPATNGIVYRKLTDDNAMNTQTGGVHDFDHGYVPDDLHPDAPAAQVGSTVVMPQFEGVTAKFGKVTKIEGGGVTVTTPDGEVDHVFDAHSVHEVAGPPATFKLGQHVVAKKIGDPNKPSLGPTHEKTGYVSKVRETDGAVMIHGSTFWYKPENVVATGDALPAFEGGDSVNWSGASGLKHTGTFQGWDTGSNGEPVGMIHEPNLNATVAVPAHDLGYGAPDSAPAPEGVVLHDKAVTATPYDQAAKGDTLAVGKLAVGDQFKHLGEDSVYQIHALAPTDAYGGPQVVAVTGGIPGVMPFESGTPDTAVTLHAKADDVLTALTIAVPEVDPVTLNDALLHGGLVPFANPVGGELTFPLLSTLPVNAQFEDKSGKTWVVKKTGPVAVVSDGTGNFTVAASLVHVKDLSQPAVAGAPTMLDTSKPIGGPEDGEEAAAKGDVVLNGGGKTLAGMHLKPGDYVQLGQGKGMGQVHKVVDVSAVDDLATFEHIASGATLYKGLGHVPMAASPGAFIAPPAPPAVEVGAPAQSLYTQPAQFADLTPGMQFTFGPSSSSVNTANSADTYVGPGGAEHTWSGGSMGVYVQPEPESPEPGPVLPEPHGEDPATVPLPKGPDDFAPPAALPQVKPGIKTDPLLPFASRMGPGGVYRYPRLSETQPGQLFSDKSGTDYRVIAHGPMYTTYEAVGSGQQFEAVSGGRVKLTALPPDPGPELGPVVNDLAAKYGSLENVPTIELADTPVGTFGTGGKASHPRLNHLKYGDVAYDAAGRKVTYLGGWLNRALVIDFDTGNIRLADGAVRVKKL